MCLPVRAVRISGDEPILSLRPPKTLKEVSKMLLVLKFVLGLRTFMLDIFHFPISQIHIIIIMKQRKIKIMQT